MIHNIILYRIRIYRALKYLEVLDAHVCKKSSFWLCRYCTGQTFALWSWLVCGSRISILDQGWFLFGHPRGTKTVRQSCRNPSGNPWTGKWVLFFILFTTCDFRI